MKRLFALLAIVALIGFVAPAQAGVAEDIESMIEAAAGKKLDEASKPEGGVCPTTNMNASCFICHTSPNFKIKEAPVDEGVDYPVNGMRADKDTVYYLIGDIASDPIAEIFVWVRNHPKIKKVSLEIHSPGGSLFDAYRIVSMMQYMKDIGYVIETKCYGFAASAGFYIFASGSEGHRIAAPNAEFMWHELLTFSMFEVKTPSSTEEQSRILRHLQDTANGWLASVSDLGKDEIDDLIHKKEFWLRGSEMIEYGFADGMPK